MSVTTLKASLLITFTVPRIVYISPTKQVLSVILSLSSDWSGREVIIAVFDFLWYWMLEWNEHMQRNVVMGLTEVDNVWFFIHLTNQVTLGNSQTL